MVELQYRFAILPLEPSFHLRVVQLGEEEKGHAERVARLALQRGLKRA